MTDDERPDAGVDLESELERLRAENARLQEQLQGASRRHAGVRWRRVGSIICAVVGAILLLLAVLTVWTRNTVLDTDQYVDTVAPLADDEDVQEAVTFRVTEAVAEAVDFRSLAEDALPPEATILAVPIESGAKNLIQGIVGELVSTPEFAQLWREVNRVGHENLAAVLKGQGNESVETEGGRVVLKLGPLAEQTITRLDELLGTDLADAIPAEELDAEFTLVESDDLSNLQDQIRWLDALSWFTVILAIGLLAAAVALAERRRVGVRRLGIAIVTPMVIGLILYSWARGQYVDGLPADVHNPDAATAIFDITTRFIPRAMRALLILGVVILVGAWLVGPSTSAAKARSWWNALLGKAGEAGAEREVGAVPNWIAAHDRTLYAVAASLGVLALVLWTRPTGLVVLLLVIAVLVVIGAVRLIAEVAERAKGTPPAAAPSDESAGASADDQPPGGEVPETVSAAGTASEESTTA